MRFAQMIPRNLARRPMRTLLTLGGVASAMLLLFLVESLSGGLDRAFSGTQAARTLIVYRQNRYCPQTSNLPEYYAERIRKVPGVESVLPVKVFLNNCRASLDLVTFQGSPVDELLRARDLDVYSGDPEKFRAERDSALVGRAFAERKNLSVGDKFRFGNIQVKVAGLFRSGEPVEEEVILTHLEYLQRSGPVSRVGTVTQFEVKIDDADQARPIAEQIDALFTSAEQPTDTRAKVLYLESATRDLREILRFARLLGVACVAVILILVGNTVVMSVQERVREFGVFRTFGFKEKHIAALVIGESLALTVTGAIVGIALAYVLVRTTDVSIGSEGVAVTFASSPMMVARGIAIAAVTGVIAGLFPAVRSARAGIVESLRSA